MNQSLASGPSHQAWPIDRSSLFVLIVASFSAAIATCFLDPQWLGSIPVLSFALLLGTLGSQAIFFAMIALAGVNLGFLTGYDSSLFAAGGGTSFEGLRLLIVLGAFSLVIVKEPNLLGNIKPVIPYLLFVTFAGISLLWSPARGHGVKEVVKLVYPLAAYVFTLALVRGGRRGVMEKLVLISAILGSVSHVLIRLAGLSTYEHFEGRYYGGWHPNLMGMFCVATGIPLLVWGLSQRHAAFLAGSLLMLIQLVLTGSRTMFLAGAVGVCVALILLRRKLVLVAAAVIGVVAWLMVPSLGERSQSFSAADIGASATGPLQNFSGRLLLWADVWTNLVPGHELAGNGLGASAAHLQSRYLVGKHVHNEYLETLADLGLLGLALLAAWLASMIVFVWRQRHTARPMGNSQIAFFASLSTFVVASLMENTLAPAAEYTVFLWVCFAVASVRESEPGLSDHRIGKL